MLCIVSHFSSPTDQILEKAEDYCRHHFILPIWRNRTYDTEATVLNFQTLNHLNNLF